MNGIESVIVAEGAITVNMASGRKLVFKEFEDLFEFTMTGKTGESIRYWPDKERTGLCWEAVDGDHE